MSDPATPNPNNATQSVLASVTLGGKPVLEAPEGMAGLNQFAMTTGGTRPGFGRFVMRRLDYDWIITHLALVKLVMTCDVGGGLTLKVIVCGAETILPSVTGNSDDDIVSVVVRDFRAGFTSLPVSGAFNVQYPDYLDTGTLSPDNCYPVTAPGGTLVTWSGVLTALSLPALTDDRGNDLTPPWGPRNLIVHNAPVGCAVDQVAGMLYLVAGWNYAGSSLNFCTPGVVSQANATLLQKANTGINVTRGPKQGVLLAGGNSVRNTSGSTGRMPGEVYVEFPVGHGYHTSPYVNPVYTKVVTTAGASGVRHTIRVPEYVACYSAVIQNQATLDAVAADVAARYYAFISQPLGVFEYAGIWPFQPDGQIRAIKWTCDRSGAKTVIQNNSAKDFNPIEDMRRTIDAVANQAVTAIGGLTYSVNSGSGSRVLLGQPRTVFVKVAYNVGDIPGQYTNSSIQDGVGTGVVGLPGHPDFTIAGRPCVAENLDADAKHGVSTNSIHLGWPLGIDAATGLPLVVFHGRVNRAVSLTVAGGGNGTPPTYTYNCVNANFDTVLTAATPSWHRPSGPLTGPAVNGMLSEDGGTLLFTDEQNAADVDP